MKNSLIWLQEWFAEQCDGDWEHQYGVSIESTDNPGWHCSIDLRETYLERKMFPSLEIVRSQKDWLKCQVKSSVFKIVCGKDNLDEAVVVFRRWVEEVKGESS